MHKKTGKRHGPLPDPVSTADQAAIASIYSAGGHGNGGNAGNI